MGSVLLSNSMLNMTIFYCTCLGSGAGTWQALLPAPVVQGKSPAGLLSSHNTSSSLSPTSPPSSSRSAEPRDIQCLAQQSLMWLILQLDTTSQGSHCWHSLSSLSAWTHGTWWRRLSVLSISCCLCPCNMQLKQRAASPVAEGTASPGAVEPLPRAVWGGIG